MRRGVSALKSTRPSRERERGRTQDRGVVRRSRRLDDCKCGRNIIDEFQVSSRTTDNCVEPTISHGIVVKRTLAQSEVHRMVQEAEKQHEAESVKHTD